MKLQIEPTAEFVEMNQIFCRIWRGVSELGVRVEVLVSFIKVDAAEDCTQFDAELTSLLVTVNRTPDFFEDGATAPPATERTPEPTRH